MKLADATVLIDHARGDATVATVLADHVDETLVVSTISLQELAVGEIAARDESLAAILNNLGAFDVRAYRPAHAYHAAGIEAELRAAGDYEPALARDILIGGVARAHSVAVLTRNPKHFHRFSGVDVDAY